MTKHFYIYCIIIIIAQSVVITDLLIKRKNTDAIAPLIKPTELSDIDGLLNQIDTLQLKSDTIKLYYETKVYNYNILPRSKRIKLFADRINK